MTKLCLLLVLALSAIGSARGDDIAWPLEPCTAAEVATASPAPLPSDSRSLAQVPFFLSLATVSAGYIVGLDKDNHPVIRCATYDSSPDLLYPGTEAVAGLVFATPRQPNTAVPDGRYLVRLFDTMGIGTIRPPPPAPILPSCTTQTDGKIVSEAPKPAHRVSPAYPDAALSEGIEGQVTVLLDIYANGIATPNCIAEATPPGWFETQALDAVSQWQFAPPGPGAHMYTVTVKFKIGP